MQSYKQPAASKPAAPKASARPMPAPRGSADNVPIDTERSSDPGPGVHFSKKAAATPPLRTAIKPAGAYVSSPGVQPSGKNPSTGPALRAASAKQPGTYKPVPIQQYPIAEDSWESESLTAQAAVSPKAAAVASPPLRPMRVPLRKPPAGASIPLPGTQPMANNPYAQPAAKAVPLVPPAQDKFTYDAYQDPRAQVASGDIDSSIATKNVDVGVGGVQTQKDILSYKMEQQRGRVGFVPPGAVAMYLSPSGANYPARPLRAPTETNSADALPSSSAQIMQALEGCDGYLLSKAAPELPHLRGYGAISVAEYPPSPPIEEDSTPDMHADDYLNQVLALEQEYKEKFGKGSRTSGYDVQVRLFSHMSADEFLECIEQIEVESEHMARTKIEFK